MPSPEVGAGHENERFEACKIQCLKGLGFGGLGFRVWGFRGLGFRGLRV